MEDVEQALSLDSTRGTENPGGIPSVKTKRHHVRVESASHDRRSSLLDASSVLASMLHCFEHDPPSDDTFQLILSAPNEDFPKVSCPVRLKGLWKVQLFDSTASEARP